MDRCVKMAELIEYNLEDVDAAILAVRVALAKGMSWEDLARMVKEEKKSGNPVAGLIDKLHLERNCITLLLSNNLDEMEDDEKTLPVDKVLHEFNLVSSLQPLSEIGNDDAFQLNLHFMPYYYGFLFTCLVLLSSVRKSKFICMYVHNFCAMLSFGFCYELCFPRFERNIVTKEKI